MNITTGKGELTRAVMEGVGFNLKVILEALESQHPIEELTLIGGGAQGALWLQILSDIWQKKVVVPQFLEEATSMGAAVCAGVGVGIYKNFSVAEKINPVEKIILPRQEYKQRYQELYEIFNHAYEALVPVYEQLSDYRKKFSEGAPV